MHTILIQKSIQKVELARYDVKIISHNDLYHLVCQITPKR